MGADEVIESVIPHNELVGVLEYGMVSSTRCKCGYVELIMYDNTGAVSTLGMPVYYLSMHLRLALAFIVLGLFMRPRITDTRLQYN